MHVDSELISRFLTGTLGLFAIVAIGGTFANLFRSAGRNFYFTRAALILALPPFCLAECIDRGTLDTLFLFAILMVVIGFLVDGIRSLLPVFRGTDSGAPSRPPRDADAEPGRRNVVWEKTE